jgi:hypothetical protein
LPVLIRRVAQRVDPSMAVHVPRPVLLKRNRLKELEHRVQLAVNKLQGPGGVLILLDADTDCPAVLGPELLGRAVQACPAMPVAVVLAEREYESWFLAAAESIGGHRGLSSPLQAPPDPEDVADAKGWLRRHMPPNRKYSETTDQPALTAVFDVDLARSHADSFDKCYREIETLLRKLTQPAPAQAPETETEAKPES